ncbi:MAG TPA: DUF523 domain-containing protein [Candidatus Omnitrophota bacterium]|nr:DUF523 domain-containing protein [Candidatus Omnitrophota bacterium]
MKYILTDKIRIGISACNFGAKVRWDHKGWDRVSALGRAQSDYIWTPICPEVMSGLGVGRDPVRLVSGNGDDYWNGAAKVKNRRGRDVSENIREGVRVCLDALKRADVEAFAFMEGSPTCGVYRTTLKDKRLGKPPGVFGAMLLKEDYFLIPALDIESPWKWWDWRRRLHAYAWLRRQEIHVKKELYDIWHALKFICQEIDIPTANAIGVALANAPGKIDQPFISAWRRQALDLVRRPSQLNRIQAVMTKHYAHYRKQFGYKIADVAVPDSNLGKKNFIEALEKLERKAFEDGYHFSGNPVAYRPPRNN